MNIALIVKCRTVVIEMRQECSPDSLAPFRYNPTDRPLNGTGLQILETMRRVSRFNAWLDNGIQRLERLATPRHKSIHCFRLSSKLVAIIPQLSDRQTETGRRQTNRQTDGRTDGRTTYKREREKTETQTVTARERQRDRHGYR